MNEITAIIEWTTNLVAENLYPGLFLAALIETLFPPIPSEVIFPLAGYTILYNDMGVFHVFTAGIIGGAGSTLGAFIIYVLVLKLGREAVTKYCGKIKISEKTIIRAEKWFSKYGNTSVLFGRLVPGIRSVISIPAGLLNMGFGKFILYTFVGSCAWSIMLTAAGYYFGVATIAI